MLQIFLKKLTKRDQVGGLVRLTSKGFNEFLVDQVKTAVVPVLGEGVLLVEFPEIKLIEVQFAS